MKRPSVASTVSILSIALFCGCAAHRRATQQKQVVCVSAITDGKGESIEYDCKDAQGTRYVLRKRD